MIEGAQKLKEKIQEVIKRVKYQPGFPDWHGRHVLKLPKKPGVQKGVTWCNAAANDILIEMGYNTKSLLDPRGIGWTNANAMYLNARKAAKDMNSGVVEIQTPGAGEFVQTLANLGICILAAVYNKQGRSGHIGIVCPTDDPYNHIGGPLIGQAGQVNGIRSESLSFDFPGLSEVSYFIIPRKKEGV